jgi:ribosomal protein S27AE
MNKMICPDCGVEMNYHADKVDYSAVNSIHFDPELGGVLEEAHTCPSCGKTHLREAFVTPASGGNGV